MEVSVTQGFDPNMIGQECVRCWCVIKSRTIVFGTRRATTREEESGMSGNGFKKDEYAGE